MAPFINSTPSQISMTENMELSPMAVLSKQVMKQVESLDEYLRSTSHEQPSLTRDTPVTVLPADAPQSAHDSREAIMDAALRMFKLAAGPSDYLANIQTSWLCHFNIFTLVPLQGTIAYADLAKAADVPEARLKSVARMAMTDGLFTESPNQHISHSATSALLCTNENFHDWATFMCDISVPTTLSMTEAHERWPKDSQKTHTAYNVAFKHNLPFFEHLAQMPLRHKQFAGYMRSATANQGTHIKHLVRGFDWASLGEGCVVDMGGSTGQSCIALAREFANLNFVVQDLPEVVSDGQKRAASLEDVGRRIIWQPHSFFDAQSVVGADVYLLRMILHDWPFEDAVNILAHLVSSLEKGSRIIIMDTVLPDPGSVPAVKERLLRVRDLTMMQTFNSQERSLEDWMAIFSKVEPKLKLCSVTQPAGSVMSLMELQLLEGR